MTDLRPIGLFLAILLALTITLYVWLFNGGNAQGVSVLMMLVPAVSAITATIMCREKLGSLGWRLGKLKYLGYAFLVPLVVAIIGYGLVWIFKFAGFYTTEVVNYKWATMVGFELPAPFFVAIAAKAVLGSLMYFVFILGEEIGWSGFLTKRLLKDYSVLKVSLMVGLFWSVWHFPAVIHGGYANYGVTKWVALVGLTLNLTGMTFFRTILIEEGEYQGAAVEQRATRQTIARIEHHRRLLEGEIVHVS
jgi:membrane protease YdiL (CAAX protease family)